MTGPDPSKFREMSEAELEATRPFILNCQGLSDRDCAQVRAEFVLAGVTAIRKIANHLERVPTQVEIDILRRALADHFNAVRIPPLRRRTLH